MAQSAADIFKNFDPGAAARESLLSAVHQFVDSSSDEEPAGSPRRAQEGRDGERPLKRKRKDRKQHKKSKKGRREREAPRTDAEKGLAAQISLARSGAHVREGRSAWEAVAGAGSADGGFRLRAPGDPDALVFASPYRLDVPAYTRAGWAGGSSISASFSSFLFRRRNAFRQDEEVVQLKLRYFSSSQLHRERNRTARRYQKQSVSRRLRALGCATTAWAGEVRVGEVRAPSAGSCGAREQACAATAAAAPSG